MKRIVVLASLITITYTHHSLCMEITATTISSENIGDYLAWHNSHISDGINMCEGVARLINKGVDINAPIINNAPRLYGKTPIETAIITECSTCAKLLKKNGANPDYRLNHNKPTPLMTAVYHNMHKRARLFLECGANPYETMQLHNGTIENVFDIGKQQGSWFGEMVREIVEKPQAIFKYWLFQQYILNSNALPPELIPLIMLDVWDICKNQ